MRNILLLLLVAVTVVSINGQGIPLADCPLGEHSVLYCPRVQEPSCDHHTTEGELYGACDIPDCFCDTPTVRDKTTERCVKLSECP